MRGTIHLPTRGASVRGWTQRSLARTLVAAVLAAAPAAALGDAFAFGRGFNDGPNLGFELLTLAATGDTCTHTRAGAVVNAPYAGTVGGAAAAGVPCTIAFTAGAAAGATFTGLGNLLVPKFPAPLPPRPGLFAPAVPVNSASSTAGPTVVGPPASGATALADWASALVPLVNIVTQSATVISNTARGGQLALGASKSVDPWFFTVLDDVDIGIQVIARDLEVSVSSDPDEFAYALVEVTGAFGIGPVVGVDAVREWSFFIEALGNGAELVSEVTLIDEIFSLTRDTEYWLTSSINALAITRSVSETATAALWLAALLGLALVNGARRR